MADSNRARVEALRRQPGVEVELLTPSWWFEEGRRVDAAPCPLADWHVGQTLFTGNGTRHVYASGFVGAIRRARPHVIDLFEEPFSLVALQALVLRNLLAPRAALVFYSAVNVDRHWRWPYRAIERAVLRGADGAHAPSADVPPVLERHGMRRKPIDVIPLGVDVERFASAEPLALEGIPRPRVGFIGRFEPVKGLDVLLEAARQLVTPASLVLAGDGSLRGELHGPRVHVLSSVAYAQVPSLLKALDVLVLPSVTILPLHREQFGRVLAESMAAGVPVIGSTSGAIPEVIGEAGLIVPERDASALAVAIDALLSRPDLRRRLIESGRQRAQRTFSWPNVAGDTLRLFEAALAQRRGARDWQASCA
ncbi:MAG: glycosyltransferase family 4 protein [Chloroflexi bacterium]|nr:glycosyltransferase family 4 protein [Chloroflexota bacterium]